MRQAQDNFQLRYVLDLITSFVNKRSVALEADLNGVLEGVWVTEVQDTTKPFESRKNGLHVYLHVSGLAGIKPSFVPGLTIVMQIVKALMLLRHPLAYSAVERVVEILPLSNLDPDFVREAAVGFGVLAEGKGKGKGKERDISHLTTKVSQLPCFMLRGGR